MAKNSITDYDNIANNNTDIQSVDIAEGCAPSGINNAIREVMADLADVNDGTVTLTSPKAATLDVTGDLTVDTNTLYVDSTNNRVGIGTNSPGVALDVNNSSFQMMRLRRGTSGTSAGIITFEQGDGTAVGHVGGAGDNGGLQFRTGTGTGTERMRITSTGDVGIGTSSITNSTGFNRVSINDTSGAILEHKVNNTATGRMITSASAVSLDAITSVPLTFKTNATERMRISSSGNVGIGTSSPQGLLEINGGTGVGTSGGTLIVRQDGDASTDGIALTSSNAISHRIWKDSGGKLNIGPSSLPSALVQDLSGNIGIGTSSFGWATSGRGLVEINGSSSALYGAKVGNVKIGYLAATASVLELAAVANVPLTFLTNNSERMRIDSSGNVGIGTNSPSCELTVSSGASSAAVHSYTQLEIESSSHSALQFSGSTGAEQWIWFADDASSPPVGGITYYHGGEYMGFRSGGSERMRISSSGDVLVGRTTTNFGNQGHVLLASGEVYHERSVTGQSIMYLNRITTDGQAVAFYRAGSLVGNISVTASSTAYNTSSDYRLKENVVTITDGIDRLKQLKPSRFNFIVDPDKEVDGFLAHEAAMVVPEAVTGNKDGVDEDGNPEYQGIDQSKLVPLLTAALQEAVAKIETLEARVVALEGN